MTMNKLRLLHEIMAIYEEYDKDSDMDTGNVFDKIREIIEKEYYAECKKSKEVNKNGKQNS